MTDIPQPTDLQKHIEELKEELQPGESILIFEVKNDSPRKKLFSVEPTGAYCDIQPDEAFTVVTVKQAENESLHKEIIFHIKDDHIEIWFEYAIVGWVFDSNGKFIMN